MSTSLQYISPQSCRAARNLLKLSQAELARLAKISTSTLRRFELGTGKASPDAARQILGVLEREGVLFIGPGERPGLS